MAHQREGRGGHGARRPQTSSYRSTETLERYEQAGRQGAAVKEYKDTHGILNEQEKQIKELDDMNAANRKMVEDELRRREEENKQYDEQRREQMEEMKRRNQEIDEQRKKQMEDMRRRRQR